MRKKNKMEFRTILVLGIIILAVISGVSIYLLKSEGTKCMGNPIKYYQEQTNAVCSCSNMFKNYIRPMVNP
jgi:hypothetical protein